VTTADSDVRPAPPADADPDSRPDARRSLYWVAAVSSVLAILCALALPFAPVSVNDPVVSWPEDPRNPQSTSLLLNAYEPRALDVRIDCAAVRAAADTADGLVFATMQPATPAATRLGLVAEVEEDRFVLTSTDTVLVDVPLPTGDCAYRIAGDTTGITVTRDGDPVEGGTADALPDIDALITSLDSLDAGDLSATVRVADPFSHSPTAIKGALLLIMGLAAAVSVGTLAASRAPRHRSDEARAQPSAPRRRFRPRPVDLVVVAVLLAWLFLAPATDDDGYYSAMARNIENEGYVAQYYQLRNQSFTPFTWFYYALGKWQTFGLSPVVLRVPALVAGLITYVLARMFVAGWLDRNAMVAGGGRRLPAATGPAARAVLAVAFLAWWLPYDMGVRPESMVPALSAGVLVATWSATARNSLPRTALALGLAAISCTVHPTGFVALAPLLVAAPQLWQVVRGDTSGFGTVSRLGAVLAAPLAVASTLAFFDGTFYDFVRSQEIFLSIQDQNTWYEEIARYGLLLNQIAMGSYAKRAAVLLGLLCLVWFVVLATAARARGVRLATELRLAAWSLALGFTLLLITPSKWTHHFGSLAGLGPVFLAIFLVSAPAVTRRLTEGRRPSTPVIVAALGSAAAVSALSLHGPNIWPYSWMLGMPQAFEVPNVLGVGLDSLALWVVGVAVLTVLIARTTRSRARTWRPFSAVLAAPALAVVMLLVVVGYLLGSFGYAAASTWKTWSPQSSAMKDPLARDCAAGGVVEVADDSTAEALPLAAPAEVPGDAVFAAEGYFPLAPPPPTIAEAGVMGSLSGPGAPELGDNTPEASIGRATTSWYSLPSEIAADEVLIAMAAGRLEGGNALDVEYGTTTADGEIEVVLTEPLTDGADVTAWRSFLLRSGDQVPQGADAVRLVARDGTTGTGGWLAFGVPTVQRLVTLQELIGDAPTAVSWQFAFNYPCAAQPVISDGITQPVQYGVVWGTQGIDGVYDNTFTEPRGGLFGQLERSAGIVRLFAQVRDRPDIELLQVYRFEQQLPERAYDLARSRETVSGLAGPG
jgi:hypothetical protein